MARVLRSTTIKWSGVSQRMGLEMLHQKEEMLLHSTDHTFHSTQQPINVNHFFLNDLNIDY